MSNRALFNVASRVTLICINSTLLRFGIGSKILRHFYIQSCNSTKINRDSLTNICRVLCLRCTWSELWLSVWMLACILLRQFQNIFGVQSMHFNLRNLENFLHQCLQVFVGKEEIFKGDTKRQMNRANLLLKQTTNICNPRGFPGSMTE